MAEDAELESGFGLLRMMTRMRPTAPKVSRIVETVELKSDVGSSGGGARRRDRDDSDQADENSTRHDGVELWPLPGLAPMTRVRTSFGDVHSIALRKGDKVLLKSGEYKPILWINRIMLDEHILALKPDSNPVFVGAGSLGPSVPHTDMMVSPRQVFCDDDRVSIQKPREAAMLVSRNGVRRFRESGLTYTMFHVGESADIYCEGVFLRFPIES